MRRKAGIFLTMLLALCMTGCSKQVVTVTGTWSEDEAVETADYIEIQEFELKDTEAEYEGEDVMFCAVMIPEGYQKLEGVPGMYVHERYPLDSSNVYYTVSEGSGEGIVSQSLTKEAYEELVEAAYKEEGQEVDLTIQSFEQIDMEGVPGYKIRSTYALEEKQVQQLAYLILAENTYTVTYSQLSDDELMADFEISDGEIRLVKAEENSKGSAEEAVSMAKDTTATEDAAAEENAVSVE